MAQLDPTRREALVSLQKDWDNREFINTIQFSIQKMVEFINKFGAPVCFHFTIILGCRSDSIRRHLAR